MKDKDDGSCCFWKFKIATQGNIQQIELGKTRKKVIYYQNQNCISAISSPPAYRLLQSRFAASDYLSRIKARFLKSFLAALFFAIIARDFEFSLILASAGSSWFRRVELSFIDCFILQLNKIIIIYRIVSFYFFLPLTLDWQLRLQIITFSTGMFLFF